MRNDLSFRIWITSVCFYGNKFQTENERTKSATIYTDSHEASLMRAPSIYLIFNVKRLFQCLKQLSNQRK